MATDHRNWFHADLPFYWTDWREAKLPGAPSGRRFHRTGPSAARNSPSASADGFSAVYRRRLELMARPLAGPSAFKPTSGEFRREAAPWAAAGPRPALSRLEAGFWRV